MRRPIVFVAGCYCAMSIAYLIRFIAGRETVSCTTDSGTQRQVLALEGLDNAWCSLVFLISYFFGLAGATWWCLLTVSLALATVWRKSHDSIKHYASYFYTLGLGAPALIIIILLVLRWVDADELVGMCYVGNHNPAALLYFVIVPQCIILIVGTIFLTLGFVAHMRTRRRQTTTGAKAENLETAAVKIGTYSVIGFILPSVCVIACNIYEYLRYDEWQHSAHPQPAIEVYLLRLLMMFTSGITTIIFIWSRKTIDAWRIALATVCCRLARYEKPQPAARPAQLSRAASISRHDYELVHQDERTRTAKSLLTSSTGADGATRSVHSHGHSSSSGVTASAANQAQSRLPAALLSTDYLNINQQLLPAGAPFAIEGEANYMMHVASDAQLPAAYHPTVHQSHMRMHRLSADQLAGTAYHCASWPQPVALNVVAPPPSLVNVCSGPGPTYYVQADSFDARRLPYSPAKDEAAF